jgi:hypothetical protein
MYYLMLLSVSRLYSIDDKVINKYGAVGGMRVDRWKQSIQRKPVPVPLSPPQILHDTTWD